MTVEDNKMEDEDGLRDDDNQNADSELTLTNLIDIGVLFHEHATTLVALLQALNPVIESLGPNPFGKEGEPSTEELEQILNRPISHLTDDLRNFINEIELTRNERGVSEEFWNSLIERNTQLIDYRQRVKLPAFRPPYLRQIARSLLNLMDDTRDLRLPKERVKRLKFHARNVERIVCLYDLTLAKARIVSMDHQVQTLRDYLTASARPKEPRRIVHVRKLVTQVVSNLESFAKEKRVELKFRPNPMNSRVNIVENDVRRALTSILHNAIKYSWQMRGEQAAWVWIGCQRKNGFAVIDFENWGVPIKRDEIQEGLIFQMGYRGSLSGDGGRLGTGIGLHDAKQIALEHGGDVTVTSEPARAATQDESYTQPYITTVTLRLPISA